MATVLTPELERQQAFCTAILQALDYQGVTADEGVSILASALLDVFVRLRKQPGLDAHAVSHMRRLAERLTVLAEAPLPELAATMAALADTTRVTLV